MQKFDFYLEDNICRLRYELKNKKYIHGRYTSFFVRDPKLRHIHKAAVGDRVVHQALFRVLYPIFDKRFIYDSYSCRMDRGTHRGVKRLADFVRKESRNYNNTAYALKCDIKKFFANIDQGVLFELISRRVDCEDTLWLVKSIIKSFASSSGKGLPLGNVTSQLFANIYLNEMDQLIKHEIKVKYYLRYCDDFIILHHDYRYLRRLTGCLDYFLSSRLKLTLHPDKIEIRKLSHGVDFLGYVVKPHYIILRTKTKRRMLSKVKNKARELGLGNLDNNAYRQSVQSYFGILKHCYGHKIFKIMRQYLR